MAERWPASGWPMKSQFFSDGRGADGVFDEVIVEAALAVAQMGGERLPVIEQIRAGLADEQSRQMVGAQAERESPQPAQRSGKVLLPQRWTFPVP